MTGAEVAEARGAVADDDVGDLADGPGDRDDAFLLAASLAIGLFGDNSISPTMSIALMES